jgi:hypothetical protein
MLCVIEQRSSHGIAYSDIWYHAVRNRLASASAVLCLLTPRSFERPWVLYEAGLAHGAAKPVYALCLGIPIKTVAHVGAFGQIRLTSDSPTEIAELIKQLAKLEGRTIHDDRAIFKVESFLKSAPIRYYTNHPSVHTDAIHYVTLAVSDLSRSEKFYRDVLGLEPDLTRPTFYYEDISGVAKHE